MRNNFIRGKLTRQIARISNIYVGNYTDGNGKVGILIASDTNDANKVLEDPDFSFIKALYTHQQSFVVTYPSLPDNPIVYAMHGFLNRAHLTRSLGGTASFFRGQRLGGGEDL